MTRIMLGLLAVLVIGIMIPVYATAPTVIDNNTFPVIASEIQSQVRIGEEFIVTVRLDYSPQQVQATRAHEFSPNYPSAKLGFNMPKQIELLTTDYPIMWYTPRTDDWYGQALHVYWILPSYDGQDIRDIELVFRINEPLLYDDERFVLTGGGGSRNIWYLSSTDDVLTISPKPLFARGSDDSKFPDKDKKPTSKKEPKKFIPGQGPVYSNLNTLSPETQASLEEYFMHNYNMTAPQSNDSGWPPDIPSPLQRYNSGIPIDEIQCSTDKILMESKSGKPYCLSENTAAKLADRGFSIVVLKKIISLEENVEISETVWNSKNFPSLNSNENYVNDIPMHLLFPKIITEMPSQTSIGEEFIVTVHLDYSFQQLNGSVLELDLNYKVLTFDFQIPKQLELMSTDRIINLGLGTFDDLYGQALHSYSIRAPYSGGYTSDVELVFRINEPLLYDDEEFTITVGGRTIGDALDIWYLSSTDDVLTISPKPLFASGSDDSKSPEKDKKPIYQKKPKIFVPGQGPVYSNLYALSPGTQANIEKYFMHHYNMTAPQSNDSSWSPEAKATYQAWLESIK